MKQRNIIAVSVFVVFYISFGVLLTIHQQKIIYRPFPQDFASCPALTYTEQVTHKGTRMYVHKNNKPTVVLYHGNAGSACDRAFYADLISQTGHGFILIEYAGYSNDPNTPTHDRIKNDVKNVVDYLNEENITEVTILGESIGTGVASYHTSLQPPERLILISPFTDLHDIARERFWFYPTSLLVENAFDNEGNLENYTGKTLFIHGDTTLFQKLKNDL